MNEDKKVPKRIAQTLINSLKGGVVPRTGLPYITVGRKNEIEALLHDVDIVAGVPDSGIAHAIGYSNESGIPYSRPFIKYTPTWPRS